MSPATKVPSGEVTPAAPFRQERGWRRRTAAPARRGQLGEHDCQGVGGCSGSKSARSTLPTWWALAEPGSDPVVGQAEVYGQEGGAEHNSTATTAPAEGHLAGASRPGPAGARSPPSGPASARADGEPEPVPRRGAGRPRSRPGGRGAASRAGRTTTAPRAAIATTACRRRRKTAGSTSGRPTGPPTRSRR